MLLFILKKKTCKALLPYDSTKLSLSDVTLAFLPKGIGGLSVCDLCVKYCKQCDRRAPCSECIMDGKPDQCSRPNKREINAIRKQQQLIEKRKLDLVGQGVLPSVAVASVDSPSAPAPAAGAEPL